MIVQSRSDESAVIVNCFQSLGRQKNVRQLLPDFDKIAAMLTPKISGDRLILTLDDKQIDTMITVLRPPLLRARRMAKRTASMNNMRQIILACMMFAQDHKDQWPDKLSQLVEKNYLSNGCSPTKRG